MFKGNDANMGNTGGTNTDHDEPGYAVNDGDKIVFTSIDQKVSFLVMSEYRYLLIVYLSFARDTECVSLATADESSNLLPSNRNRAND